MDRAAGCSRDARRPAQTPERDRQWQQDRVVRRLLLPGRRAVRRVRTRRRVERAAWPIPFAASAAAAARRPLRSKATERFRRRHAPHTAAMRGRPRRGIPPHTSQSEEFVLGSFRGFGCVFASLRRIASAKETHNRNRKRLFFLFGSKPRGNNGIAKIT